MNCEFWATQCWWSNREPRMRWEFESSTALELYTWYTQCGQQNKQHFQNCGDFEQHSFMNIRHSGDWCENFCDLFCDKSGARLGTRGGANTWGEKQSHNEKLEKICLFKSPRLIGVSLGIREVGFICGGRKTWEEGEKWRDKGRPVEKVIADDFILETRN